MGWYDLYQQKVQSPSSARPRAVYRPTFYQTPRERSQGGYRPSAAGGVGGGSGFGRPAAPTMPKSVAPPTTQPAIPERLDFSLSYNAYKQPDPPKDTMGDIGLSLAGAAGGIMGAINPMNAIPWLMERVHEAASAVDESNDGIVGGGAGLVSGVTGGFLDAFTAASEAVAPIVDWLPTQFRDNHLRNRAKLYTEMLTGADQDWGPLWLNQIEFSVPGPGSYDTNANWKAWRQLRGEYESSLDPEKRADIKSQMAVMMDAVDLPDEVKQAIAAKRSFKDDREVDDLIDKAVTATGVGRQWAYGQNGKDVLGATWQNLSNQTLWYGVEAAIASRLTGGLTSSIMGGTETSLLAGTRTASGGIDFLAAPVKVATRTPGLATSITRNAAGEIVRHPGILEQAGHATAGARLGTAGNVTRTAVKTAQRIQKYALMSGLGTAGITGLLDAKARYEGDEEAVRWFEKLNAPGDFSANPSVQLITGFSVNPFGVANDLRKGVVKVGSKATSVIIGKRLGQKLAQTMEPGDLVDQVFAKMYRLQPEEVEDFAAKYYGDRGERFDEVVGLAMDHVLDNLPAENRGMLLAAHAGDTEGLQKAIFETYGNEIFDVLVNHQDELAQRFTNHAWQYHEYPGMFNGDVAALNARDMRTAKARTYEFRQRTDSVVGYNDYLQPEAAGRAREWLARNTVDGKVSVEGKDGLQDLIRMFPSLRKRWQGKVGVGARDIDAADVERMIQEAETIFHQEYIKNPLRATTGVDPTLRPGYGARDLAPAIGTDEATARALLETDDTKTDLVRALIKEKTGLTDEAAAALSEDDVWSRAMSYYEKVTKPWRERGEQLVAAEKGAAAAKERLRVLYAIEPNLRTAQQQARVIQLETEIRKLELARSPLAKAASAEARAGKTGADIRIPAAAKDAELSKAWEDVGVGTGLEEWANVSAPRTGRPGSIEALPSTRAGQNMVSYVSRDADGRIAGYATFAVDASGKIADVLMVSVREDVRRSGVATRLYDAAARDGLDVRSVTGTNGATAAGEAFSSAYKARPSAPAGPGPKAAALAVHDAQIAPLRAELAELNRIPAGRRTAGDMAEIATLEAQLETLTDTLNAANDELALPFGEQVEVTRASAKMADRIREMDPGNMTAGDRLFVKEYLATQADMTYNPTLPIEDLLSVAKEHANTHVAAQTGRGVDLATRALRKVAAQRILSDIADLDAQAVQASPNVSGMADLARLFTRVQGNLVWSGGAAPATRGLRNDIFRVLTRTAPTKGAFADGISTQAKSSARWIETMSDHDVWDFLHKNPEVVRSLNKRYQKMIEAVRKERNGEIRGSAPDDFVPQGYMGRTGMSETESWIEDAAALVTRYEDLLDEAEVRMTRAGTPNVRDLQVRERAAGDTGIPQVYLDEAADAIDNGVHVDPRRAVQERNSLAELNRILDVEGVDDAMLNVALEQLPVRLARKLLSAFESPDGTSQMFSTPLPERIAKIRETLFPEGSEKPATSGPETGLDDALVAGDVELVKAKTAEYMASADQTVQPIRTSTRAARLVTDKRPSYNWRTAFRSYGVRTDLLPDQAVIDAPGNATGLEVLSILNHGVIGTRPKTIRRVIDLMRLIEDGTATRMGIGVPFQAEAMRVADDILSAHIKNGKRLGFLPGVMESGMDEAALALDDFKLAEAMRDSVELGIDTQMPNALGAEPMEVLGTLQYGFKKRPGSVKKGTIAVPTELQQFPGMAEEFLEQRFATVEQRVATAKLRQAFNYVFGPYSNRAVHGAIRQRFIERAARAGVDPSIASKVWQRWQQVSDESRGWEFRKRATGGTEMLNGDAPLYAGVRNIDNGNLRGHALKVVNEELRGKSGDLDYIHRLEDVRYDDLFRESESFVRRTLADAPVPLGKGLARAYGMAAHSKAVTTLYYWFRFGLDVRYHAMNFFESQILYLGRAGFRKGEIDRGLLGMSEGMLRRTDMDVANNTGYAMSRSRFSYAYRTFLKEQPNALRGTLKALEADSPELMEKAVREMAEFDPQIRDMITEFGDTPDGWMRAMDEWHGKMLKTVDDIEAGQTIDDALLEAMRESPALNEIYGALSKANKDTWANVRNTFMGNPDRSRIERLMNSYLLFWPISYQIKATKWMLRVMFDKMGGLPTNAGGAVMLGKVTESHRTLMENDPEYRDWYEQHPTLMFIAQSLLPITPESMGVSMSPVLRNLIPGGPTKALWDIGPIWTTRHIIGPMTEEAGADIYPTLKSLPFGEAMFGSLTGQGLERYRPKYWGD